MPSSHARAVLRPDRHGRAQCDSGSRDTARVASLPGVRACWARSQRFRDKAPGRRQFATLRADWPRLCAEPPMSFAASRFCLQPRSRFRRWRHAGGNDIASLGLIVEVAAVGLGSFAFHASLVPLPCLFCSYLFVVRHRLPRLPAHSADILNGPIGYVPALGIVRLRCAPDTPAPAGVGPQRGAGTCAENWPVATWDIRGVHDVARVTIE